MANWFQKYRLKWPWTPTQVVNVDQMFQEISTAINQLNSRIDHIVATPGAPGSPGVPGVPGSSIQISSLPGSSTSFLDEVEGPMGPPGPIGLTGFTGSLGAPGIQGEDGEDGRIGPPGLIGPQGLKGDSAPFFPVLDEGDEGPMGPPGPIGLIGASGRDSINIVNLDSEPEFDWAPFPPGYNDYARLSLNNTFLKSQNILDSSTSDISLTVTNSNSAGYAALFLKSNSGKQFAFDMTGSTHTTPDRCFIQSNNGVSISIGDTAGDAVLIDTTKFIDSPTQPRAVAYAAGTQALTTATFTAVNLDTEDIDVSGMHDNVTNNTRMTIPTGGDGLYLVIGYLQYTNNVTGQRQVDLKKNGTTFIAQTLIVPSGTFNTAAMVTWLGVLVATDYVELFGFQDSGGNLNVGSASRFAASSLSIVKLW